VEGCPKIRLGDLGFIVGMLAVLAVLGACLDTRLDPLPLTITITPNKTTTIVGDTVVFVTESQGGSMLGLDMNYGDGTADPFALSGARTARVSFKHAYGTKGTYQVQVTVTDATQGTKSATTQVAVP